MHDRCSVEANVWPPAVLADDRSPEAAHRLGRTSKRQEQRGHWSQRDVQFTPTYRKSRHRRASALLILRIGAAGSSPRRVRVGLRIANRV